MSLAQKFSKKKNIGQKLYNVGGIWEVDQISVRDVRGKLFRLSFVMKYINMKSKPTSAFFDTLHL